jgi:copper chaperone
MVFLDARLTFPQWKGSECRHATTENPMIAFQVKDMTCGHCASTITKAVKAADPASEVRIDLGQHRVEIEPASADPQALEEAIKEAGYTPVAVPV